MNPAILSRAGRSSGLGRGQELAWWAFVLLACAQFTIRLVWRGGSFLNLPRYANGQEIMPFQGRVLMAWILKASAGNPHVNGFLLRLGGHLPPGLGNPYSLVLLVVNFIAIVIAILAGRFTLEYLTGDATFSAWGSLLLLYMSYFNLIIGYGIFFMPYDVVSLAVFMVSVWLIVTRRYMALISVFVLGTLNRETTIFIPVFLGLYNWFNAEGQPSAGVKSKRTAGWPYVAALVLLWFALRFWIRHLFLHNPAQPSAASQWFGIHLEQNLLSLAKPQQWPLLLSVCGFTVPFFIWKFDRIGHRALSRATAIVAVLWTLAMLIVGVIVEIRIFNELSAFLMPCIALILWHQWIQPAAAHQASSK